MFHDEVEPHDANEDEDLIFALYRMYTGKWADMFSRNTVASYYMVIKLYREKKPQISARLYHLMDQSKKAFKDRTQAPC